MARVSAVLAALFCVAGLAWAGSPSLDDAARILGDPGRPFADRRDAIRVLVRANDPAGRDRALPPLLAALSDDVLDVRSLAAQALARLADPRALLSIVRRLDVERDPVGLSALLLAIGGLGGRPELAVVEPYTRHAELRVRAAAVTALGDLGGPVARERLLGLLAVPGQDPEWALRGSVLLALARCGTPADSGTILVAYREGGGAAQWFARAALSSAMAALDPDPVPLLDRLCADPDARVSSAAALAFVRAGRVDEVVRRLADARPGVRAAAAAAVGGAELRRAIPQVLALATGDPDRSVRWSATLALSRLDDPASDELLLAGLLTHDPEVWTSALAELRRKTDLDLPRDVDAWRAQLAALRRRPR